MRGGLKCGLDCIRLHQFLVLSTFLLKLLYICGLNFLLLVEPCTWKFIQGHQHCACSTIFMVRVSYSDAIPPWVMASVSAEQGGSFAFCLMPVHEEAVLGPSPVFSCLIKGILNSFGRRYYMVINIIVGSGWQV